MSNMPDPEKGTLWRRKGTIADYRVSAIVVGAKVELCRIGTTQRHWVTIREVPRYYDWLPRLMPKVAPTIVDPAEFEEV